MVLVLSHEGLGSFVSQQKLTDTSPQSPACLYMGSRAQGPCFYFPWQTGKWMWSGRRKDVVELEQTLLSLEEQVGEQHPA